MTSPLSILDEIHATRAQIIERLHDCALQLLDDYLSGITLRCEHDTQNKTCDAVILGCILQELMRIGMYPNITLSSTGITQLVTLLRSLHIPFYYQTVNSSGKRHNGTISVDSHSTTCSPLPAFLYEVGVIFNSVQGLDYNDFVSAKSEMAGRFKARKLSFRATTESLWNCIEYKNCAAWYSSR